MSDQKAGGRDNQGYLYPNEQRANDRQPHFRGKLTVNGKEFLVSGWNRDKDGQTMISLSVTDPATMPPRQGGGQGGNQGGGQGGGQGSRGASAPAPSASGGLGDIFDGLPG